MSHIKRLSSSVCDDPLVSRGIAHVQMSFLSCIYAYKGGLFPTESHEYEVFRFALSHHQDIPKLVPQELVWAGFLTHCPGKHLFSRRRGNVSNQIGNVARNSEEERQWPSVKG
ncbi:Glutamate receptor 1, partial [Dissostichus eleginoides]